MSNNKVIYFTTLLVTLMIIFVVNDKPQIVGMATYASSPEVSAVLNTLSKDDSLQLLADNAEICVVTEIDANTTYYHRIVKSGSLVSVTEQYCADPGQDNLIVKFNSYDALLDFNSDPVEFIKTKKNIDYFIFPSNHISFGGEITCSAEFQKKYCVATYFHMKKSDLEDIGLKCCADYALTEEDQDQIDALKGKKKGILESPLEFLFSTTGIIVVIGAVIFIIVIAALIMVKPKNPISDYVKSVRQQGYSDEDIQRSLADAGWDEKTINDALKAK